MCFKFQVKSNFLCEAKEYLKDLTRFSGPILLLVITYLYFSFYSRQKATTDLFVSEILACWECHITNRMKLNTEVPNLLSFAVKTEK